jgi:hypothetical protein
MTTCVNSQWVRGNEQDIEAKTCESIHLCEHVGVVAPRRPPTKDLLMRTALLAAFATFLFAASLACTKPTRPASRELVERQVNERLDRQLHATLQKLLSNQTARLDGASGAGLLTAR